MPARILVAFASRARSTAEAAEAIGQVLRDRGAEVDVQSVKDVHGARRAAGRGAAGREGAGGDQAVTEPGMVDALEGLTGATIEA